MGLAWLANVFYELNRHCLAKKEEIELAFN